ncbi:myosin heavy chain, embryonic smooth muscle isoform, putative [Entamoeba invadens IP1]|uniref:Myosin heavy chain, embryonic smooth muscle isoform, putative n=1 Tax=Entamoeba invadens IP1 TaxID=370355 RepID=A0A0A1UD92_ENTIV|nr:myosin heavy chain, embryonic smooth muscle isoform, putative [Entamoeba invadens IP1]ELP91750.1 myosin heavy chain, embryonic smooth muscle isoform, putative [Entamoeba invadens IP1]|eukprot:XP_004258521.1 myosin heavy chain, embryonic smooth muscle isoform, putative [Entamoeba invadens IP1]
MINDLNAEVDKAQRQLDTANDDKDGNEAMKQKYQDELMSVRTELDQEKKYRAETQLIKGKYEKDIAEITVKVETFEKNVQMDEQKNVENMRDYKTAIEKLMRTKTELDEKQNECDKLEDDMSEMKTELEAFEQAAKTYKQSKNTYEKELTELNEQLDLERTTAQQAKAQKKSNADKLREVIKNEFGEYKEHVDEFINSLTAQKADSQKELEKERAMKQKPDKETQRLRAKVEEAERKLVEFEQKESTFNTQIGKTQSDLKKTQQSVRDGELRIAELEDQVRKAGEDLNNKQFEVDKINAELKKTKNGLKKMQKDTIRKV